MLQDAAAPAGRTEVALGRQEARLAKDLDRAEAALRRAVGQRRLADVALAWAAPRMLASRRA